MSDDPKVEPVEKPVLSPLVGGKPEPGPAVGPVFHGEAAQRFVNKNAAHSERVLQGKIVTPPVRKERYEHPERKA